MVRWLSDHAIDARDRADLTREIRWAKQHLMRLLPELQDYQKRWKVSWDTVTPLEECTLQQWLDTIKWDFAVQSARIHATAHCDKNLVVFNRGWMAEARATYEREAWVRRFRDLILHEIGHLFTVYWCKRYPLHDKAWRELGRIVGYAPFGSTSERRRMQVINSSCVHRWDMEPAPVQTTPLPSPPRFVATKAGLQKLTVASVIRKGLLEGLDTDAILSRVRELFPASKATGKDVSYYRYHLRKEGRL